MNSMEAEWLYNQPGRRILLFPGDVLAVEERAMPSRWTTSVSRGGVVYTSTGNAYADIRQETWRLVRLHRDGSQAVAA
jgi:hypothetical protein